MTAAIDAPEDFTEDAYARLVAAAASRLRLLPVGEALPMGAAGAAEGLAAWRHDVDMSPQRALAMARIEAAAGVRATYFVLLGGAFYNPLEEPIVRVLREIAGLGHELGLHFDASTCVEDPVGRVRSEADLLARAVGRPIEAVSLHNPSVARPAAFAAPRVGGLLNATCEALRAPFVYASDSNGVWRFRPLPAVVADPGVRSLYALTHPEWWTPHPMPPAERIRRCIEGRAAAVARDYVALISRHRPEVLAHVR